MSVDGISTKSVHGPGPSPIIRILLSSATACGQAYAICSYSLGWAAGVDGGRVCHSDGGVDGLGEGMASGKQTSGGNSIIVTSILKAIFLCWGC